MSSSNVDRRAFLRVLAGIGAACAGCAPSAGTTAETFGDVPAGKASDLAVGQVRVVSGQPVFIARDAGGLYAMSTTCTHQGCDLGTQGTIGSGHITCGCHGSQFDTNGGVLRGPASDPLVHFAVTVDAQGAITIHGGQQVSAATRVAV